MDLRFYTKRIGNSMPSGMAYPCFLLIETKWTDDAYRTQYTLVHYERARQKTDIGNVKILKPGQAVTKLPKYFKKLPAQYYSLGQAVQYYETLELLFSNETLQLVLKALNDITALSSSSISIIDKPGVKESLLRSSEAQKAYRGKSRTGRKSNHRQAFHFSFSTQINGFVVPHIVHFRFNKVSQLPRRMAAIIGKNGSGKTQYLARLASSLSGLKNQGDFDSKFLPPFSRVIAVSYSLFDRFEKPKPTKDFSYFFCGIDSESKMGTYYSLQRRLSLAVKEIQANDTLEQLKVFLKELLDALIVDAFINEFFSSRDEYRGVFFDENGFTKLSSGQILIIVVVTELIAYLRPDSIVLFDEPETHLHPNVLSKLMAVISSILSDRDAFAIFATHSAQIIQEIPSTLIYRFDDEKTNPPVAALSMETFGENLTTLTENIFNVQETEQLYKKVISELFGRMNKDEIFQLFEKEGLHLSLNARLYIEYQAIINEKS